MFDPSDESYLARYISAMREGNHIYSQESGILAEAVTQLANDLINSGVVLSQLERALSSMVEEIKELKNQMRMHGHLSLENIG